MLVSPALPLPQHTVYFTVAMQVYMNQEIKKPVLEAVDVLFDPKSSSFQKMKAVKTFWQAFQALKGLPEPTKENTWHPNTHNLIDIRDWLWERCHLGKLRMGMIRRVINFVIILHAFDPPWRWIFDSLIDEGIKKQWKPRGYEDTWIDTYSPWWREEDAKRL